MIELELLYRINDLINRMASLRFSLFAGNNGVKNDLSEVMHELHKLGNFNDEQLKLILEVYEVES